LSEAGQEETGEEQNKKKPAGGIVHKLNINENFRKGREIIVPFIKNYPK
jgi:hypothetical protein